MLHRILGNQDIPHAQIGMNRACAAGIDDIIHAEMVNQNLCADRRIHLPNATDD